MTETSVTPADILAFWRDAGPKRWYTPDEAFDAEVRRRFLGLWQKAAASELSSWEASDDGALALVIVLDQFPRNMFRGDARTYASDALAREVASRAIQSGVDGRIDDPQAGWKGRGIWATYSSYMPKFTETKLGNIEHIQLRPNPLAN